MAKPIYEKIANTLKKEICNGILLPDSRLPKITDLAKRFNVSYVTMSNAIQLLAKMGYVTTIQGSGIFVNSSPANKYSNDIIYLAPIEGDLYGRCFRAFQDAVIDDGKRILIGLSNDQFFTIARKNEQKLYDLLQDYATKTMIIDGTRHFPFSFLKKINPSGRNIYFFMHCECGENEFPEAVKIIPDFYNIGCCAAEKLFEHDIKQLFLLSYEELPPEKNTFAGNPPFTYEKLIHSGMNDFAAKHNLPPIEIIRGTNDHIEDCRKLDPFKNKKCGFMAIGDNRAHNLYRYAKQQNIRINDNWHVIGLGKTSWCDIMEPKLNSFSLCEISMMRRLAEEIKLQSNSKYIPWQFEL